MRPSSASAVDPRGEESFCIIKIRQCLDNLRIVLHEESTGRAAAPPDLRNLLFDPLLDKIQIASEFAVCEFKLALA